MRTASERIAGAFQLIDEVFDELKRCDGVRWGESVRETIEEAIRTYKCEVEKTCLAQKAMSNSYWQLNARRLIGLLAKARAKMNAMQL